MTRTLLAFLLTLGLGATGLVIAQPTAGDQEPPVRLKKKKKDEQPEPPPDKLEVKPEDKPKRKIDEDDGLDRKDDIVKPEPDDETDPEQEILDRIQKNVKASEDRLAERDAGDKTQSIQDEIVKDLDKLIEQMNQDQNNQGGGGGGGGGGGQSGKKGGRQQAQNQGGGGQGGQSTRDRREQRRLQREEARGGQQPGGRNGENVAQGGQPQQNPGGNGNNPGGGGVGEGNEKPKTVDRKYDLWGHLPERERALMHKEMEQKFMDKYDELTKQYYRTIAEKSRKKDK